MKSLEIEHSSEERRLIGDKSRHHVLPTLAAYSTKHTDLNSISPATLKSLLNGEFDSSIGRFLIFDSRYPYEFEAGHIRGAQNVFTKESLVDLCFGARQLNETNSSLPVVIIFHCEFSSERGPSMLRFLRSQDRAMNKDVYPHLFYPELYLLDGGYKNFFEKHPVRKFIFFVIFYVLVDLIVCFSFKFRIIVSLERINQCYTWIMRLI